MRGACCLVARQGFAAWLLLCKEQLACTYAAGKDVFWYTREKQEEEAAKARLEMQAIKQREEDLMNEVGEQQQALNSC